MEKVGADSLACGLVPCFFKQVQFTRTIKRLLCYSATDVLLNTGFQNIRTVSVPGYFLTVGRGKMRQHWYPFMKHNRPSNFIPFYSHVQYSLRRSSSAQGWNSLSPSVLLVELGHRLDNDGHVFHLPFHRTAVPW